MEEKEKSFMTEKLQDLCHKLDSETIFILVNELGKKFEYEYFDLRLCQKIKALQLCFENQPEIKIEKILKKYIKFFNFGDCFYNDNFEHMSDIGKISNLAIYLTKQECISLCIEEGILRKDLEILFEITAEETRISKDAILRVLYDWCRENYDKFKSWEKAYEYIENLSSRIKSRLENSLNKVFFFENIKFFILFFFFSFFYLEKNFVFE